jgi:tRNA pseudouridine65 synthase
VDGRACKRYLVLVRGVPPDEGIVDHPIPRREGGPRVPARTAYRRLCTLVVAAGQREPRYSLCEARPHSGRLHQIRRHLKHLGHPVLGDASYGRAEHNHLCRDRYGLDRLALHAAALTLDHPTTGSPIHFAAPLPPDLRAPLERMGFAV